MFKYKKFSRRELFFSLMGTSAIASIFAANHKLLGDISNQRRHQFQIFESNERNFSRKNDPGLKSKAAAQGLIYGAFPEASAEKTAQDLQFQSHFIQECALIAAGDVWGSICPEPNQFKFTNIDYFAQFAADNNLVFKLDVAVWHEFLPSWLMAKFQDRQTTAVEIENILSQMVQTVGRRYAKQAYAWSVVNEVINPSDGRRDSFRDTQISDSMQGEKYPTWLHFLDTNFVDLAFRAAAEVAPQTTLLYNDFALEYDTAQDESKRHAVLKLLEKLKSQGTPIHALGIQAHLNASMNPRFNQNKYRQFLSDVASLGLKIQITELDVADKWLPNNMELATRDLLVAEAYYDFLEVALDEPAVDTVVTWGLSDRYTWLSWFAPREDDVTVRPLPLDEQLNRKLAWNAIAEALENAPKR
ncbi:MAG: endo-1,4-beta-xylanase [Cyanobacteria bacterium J06638_38]